MNTQLTQEDLFGAQSPPAADETPQPQALIVVTQLPEIAQRLHLVKTQIEQGVTDALAMEITDANRIAAKGQLAEMRKAIKALEDQRLAIRREILAPYDEMEAVYRACVTDVWKPAEAQLSGRIADIEDGLIAQKRAEVEPYFTELCAAHGLDFLTLEDTGAKINLTNKVKALKEECKRFVDRVLEDLNMIATHSGRAAEILVEYKRNGFNAQRAVIDVNRRMDAIEHERARQEQLAAQREQEVAAMARVEEAAEAFAPPVEEPVSVEEAPAPQPEDDPIIPRITFALLIERKSRVIRMREFLQQEEYNYVSPA
jgi:hypothetical protein